MFVFGVAATGFHVNPDGVQAGMIFSVNCLLFASNLSAKTTATLSMTATKMGSTNDNGFAAVTLAKPLSFLRIAVLRPLNHRQPPEPLAGQVNQLSHAVPLFPAAIAGSTPEILAFHNPV